MHTLPCIREERHVWGLRSRVSEIWDLPLGGLGLTAI